MTTRESRTTRTFVREEVIPVLTVGQLRQILATAGHLDDDVRVVMDDGRDWYTHVAAVEVPDPDPGGEGLDPGGFQCLTLVRGEPFDTRDL
jgi:hypothetical protein